LETRAEKGKIVWVVSEWYIKLATVIGGIFLYFIFVLTLASIFGFILDKLHLS